MRSGLRTIEHGDPGAPVALLLHGLPGGAEDWNALAPRLAEAGLHAVAVDRPGYGGSGPDALRAEQQVGLYAALLGDLGGRPALVVGHSYGAIPASWLAARHPELVGALGLLAPALREEQGGVQIPAGVEGLGRLLANPTVAGILEATLLSQAGRGLIARLADPTAFAPDPVDEDHVAGVRDRTLQLGAVRSSVAEAAAIHADAGLAGELLGTIAAPSAVIHARGDRVVAAAAGARTAKSIPDCEHHEIEGGHMLTISRVREVSDRLVALARRAGLLDG